MECFYSPDQHESKEAKGKNNEETWRHNLQLQPTHLNFGCHVVEPSTSGPTRPLLVWARPFHKPCDVVIVTGCWSRSELKQIPPHIL